MAVIRKTYLKVDPHSLISAKIFRNVIIKSTHLGIKDEYSKACFYSPVHFAMMHALTRTDYHLQKGAWSKIIRTVCPAQQ